jgi:hypothetical protein
MVNELKLIEDDPEMFKRVLNYSNCTIEMVKQLAGL